MITIYLLEFLLFSFLGWLLDSGYRSFVDRRWVNAGYFTGPICPIYGFGGITLIFLFKQVDPLLPITQILLAGMTMTLVEYLGGIFCEHILRLKLWDYSHSRFHVGGHIDVLHSSYWFLFGIVFYYWIFPALKIIETIIFVPEFLELPIFLTFLFTAIWLTIRKSPQQYLELKQKVMNITVERYQQLYSNIQKFYATTSVEKQKQLKAMIKKQLENTGAYWRKLR